MRSFSTHLDQRCFETITAYSFYLVFWR